MTMEIVDFHSMVDLSSSQCESLPGWVDHHFPMGFPMVFPFSYGFSHGKPPRFREGDCPASDGTTKGKLEPLKATPSESPKSQVRAPQQIGVESNLVGGLEQFLFFHILGMSSSQLTFICFREVETTNR